MTTKTCTKCKQELPLERFWRNKRTKDGHEAQCKMCRMAVKTREPIEKAEETVLETMVEGYETQLEFCRGRLKAVRKKIEKLSTDLVQREGTLRATRVHLEALEAYRTRVESATLFQRIFKLW